MDDRRATMDDAVREYARNAGAARPDVEWILSSYDTWHKNPYYTGEPGRHPEDPPEDWDES
jgi:hypothetical protein